MPGSAELHGLNWLHELHAHMLAALVVNVRNAQRRGKQQNDVRVRPNAELATRLRSGTDASEIYEPVF